MPALPRAVPAAIESGPWIRDPGRRWAFLDAVKGNWPGARLEDPRSGCPRWPEGWYLVNERTGLAVQGRCKATNLCPYCRDVYLRETAAVVALEAAVRPPTVYAVMTARELLTRAQCKHPLEMIRRWTRARWPASEWFLTVELQQRGALHLNLLGRGVPPADAGLFRLVAAREWCKRVDALPVGQHAGPIWDADGVARYVAKFSEYVTKSSQQPGLGWPGHRTSQTRGFFPEGLVSMRRQVRRLQVWRVLYARALDMGLRDLRAVSWATSTRAIAERDVWSLVDVGRAHTASLADSSRSGPMSARAKNAAEESPSASVQRYVHDQRTHGRLFDPYAY